MFSYTVCGRRLDSTIPLPELSAQEALSQQTMAFAVEPVEGADGTVLWRGEANDGGEWLVCSRRNGAFVLRFPGSAVFEVSPDGLSIRGWGGTAVDEAALRHLLLDHVIPRALTLTGALVLHGSAVVVDGRVVGLLGRSGSGKSTIAAAMNRRGHALVADDCLVIDWEETAVAAPSYAGIRLWPDSIEAVYGENVETTPVAEGATKRRVGERYLGPSPVPNAIAAIFSIATEHGCAPRIERLGGRAAIVELLKETYRLDLSHPVDELDCLTLMASTVPIFRLRRGGLDGLPALCDAVLAATRDAVQQAATP